MHYKKRDEYEFKYISKARVDLPFYNTDSTALITTDKIYDFAKNIKVGDTYRVTKPVMNPDGKYSRRSDTVLVLRKYPFVVETDKGAVPYLDFYIGTKID
jgi:hypothetical protein